MIQLSNDIDGVEGKQLYTNPLDLKLPYQTIATLLSKELKKAKREKDNAEYRHKCALDDLTYATDALRKLTAVVDDLETAVDYLEDLSTEE